MRIQHENLVRLEAKHREVCETYGISQSLNQTRADNLQKLIEQNHNRKIKEQDEDESKRQKFDLTETGYKEIVKKLADMKAERNAEEKSMQ